jgi:hypothetical protein
MPLPVISRRRGSQNDSGNANDESIITNQMALSGISYRYCAAGIARAA